MKYDIIYEGTFNVLHFNARVIPAQSNLESFRIEIFGSRDGGAAWKSITLMKIFEPTGGMSPVDRNLNGNVLS